MKSYEIKPTDENLLKTYLNDAVGRNQELHYFIELLDNVKGACTIALDGAWGSGKTFFVKQEKMILDAFNPFTKIANIGDKNEIENYWENYSEALSKKLQPQVCIYYDAWINDNDEDPILSLIYTILQSVNQKFNYKDSDYIKRATSILEFFSAQNWNALINSFKSEDPLAELKNSKDIQKMVEEFLNSLLAEKGNRLIVFVDELDRCKPNYAVKFLERIKHYFDNDQITFVFSTNINELQHTIKCCYGNDFNAGRYLERFFDYTITLPPANLEKYFQLIGFNNQYYIFDMVCHAIIQVYHLELREITKYVALSRMAAYDPTHDNTKNQYELMFAEGKGLEFCLCYIIPIMIGLRIADKGKYNDFINGKDYSPLMEIAECLPKNCFSGLLSIEEKVNENSKRMAFAKLNDKLKKVYTVLFDSNHVWENYPERIGEVTFEKGMREKVLRVDSLLSKYADYTL